MGTKRIVKISAEEVPCRDGWQLDCKNYTGRQRYFYEFVEVVTKAKAIRQTENYYYCYLTLYVYQLVEAEGVGIVYYCVSVIQ